jgi:type III pantothenate kinase
MPLIAVDVGNARTKLGRFVAADGASLPEPESVLALDNRAEEMSGLEAWLEPLADVRASWSIGSVNRAAATRLIDWLRTNRPDDSVTLLSAADLALEVDLPRPDMVGIDRLLDALAANHLRKSDRPAVVVDVGTAITVDLVSAGGVFLGGAILPGIAMSARALYEFTDLLPLIPMSDLTNPPTPVGESTESAMHSGLFWGAVGSVRELIAQMAASLPGDNSNVQPDAFLTGGAGPVVAHLLGESAHYVGQLTLAGIILATRTINS